MRDKLIDAGVKNLKEYGYPGCTSKNILTDEIYSQFFTEMLNENKGVDKKLDVVIDGLLSDLMV